MRTCTVTPLLQKLICGAPAPNHCADCSATTCDHHGEFCVTCMRWRCAVCHQAHEMAGCSFDGSLSGLAETILAAPIRGLKGFGSAQTMNKFS